MRYKLYKKFYKKIECNILCLCGVNILIGNKNKLISYTFNGEVERQWIFESSITCIKGCGGPSRRDLVLVGLKSGGVYKIYLDNSFPINIYKL